MKPELVRLKKEDFKEVVNLLNFVFTVQNGAKTDFESLFPRIFIESEETMGWHVGAKIDGKLCGIAASYPLTYRVGGVDLKVSAGGNVAVDSNFRGQGVMQSILNEIDKQDRENGFDISYLHGDRFRYRNFGYERCGIECSFTILRQMVGKDLPKRKIRFLDLRSQNEALVKDVYKLYNQQSVLIFRDYDSFMLSLTAKGMVPFAVLTEEEKLVGYFCIGMNNFSISEIFIKDTTMFKEIIKNFMQQFNTGRVTLSLPYYDPLTEQAFLYSDRCSIVQPANFKIYNFKRVVESFMKEKMLHETLPDGCITLDSEIFGKWSIKKIGEKVQVEEYSGQAEYVLPEFTVYHFLFGSLTFKEYLKGDKANVVKAWFPLPLYCPYLT
ncbi:MAG: GNAT family N-acetyltransferase [Clostridia bacterium]|nr:GNAT family N-acetyltransferase [Clostridia bacterium]